MIWRIWVVSFYQTGAQHYDDIELLVIGKTKEKYIHFYLSTRPWSRRQVNVKTNDREYWATHRYEFQKDWHCTQGSQTHQYSRLLKTWQWPSRLKRRRRFCWRPCVTGSKGKREGTPWGQWLRWVLLVTHAMVCFRGGCEVLPLFTLCMGGDDWPATGSEGREFVGWPSCSQEK